VYEYEGGLTMAKVLEVRNWGGRVIRVMSNRVLTVAKDHRVAISGILCVPGKDYEPPGPNDRWTDRCEDTRYRGVLDVSVERPKEAKEVAEFSASVLSLADSWYRLTNLRVNETATKMNDLIGWMAAKSQNGSLEDIEQIANTLNMATVQFQTWRAELCGAQLKLPIILDERHTLEFTRRENNYLGSKGPVIEDIEPVELEIIYMVRSPNLEDKALLIKKMGVDK
jgi:hypothetical protein